MEKLIAERLVKDYSKLLREMKWQNLKVEDMPEDVAEAALKLHQAALAAYWQLRHSQREKRGGKDNVRVLICGSRNWTDYRPIKNAVEALMEKHKHVIVIDGMAKGADDLGYRAAADFKLGSIRFAADWNRYGNAAGPIRNKRMLKEGKPDLVLAFHSDLSKSKGTKHMVEIARKAGVEVIVIDK
jgi:hypothetical protein